MRYLKCDCGYAVNGTDFPGETSGKDAWICIPMRVKDDFIGNLAFTFRNGNSFTGNKWPSHIIDVTALTFG